MITEAIFMEKWTQTYDPLASLAPIFPQYLLSALVAAIPMAVLFYMLAVRRSPGHKAAFAGLASTALLAVLVWGMPMPLAANAAAMGACFGLFPIVWIVVAAVWFYNMTVESGEFEIIKNSLASLTDDRRLQAIFIAFAFGSFLEGAAGFGTPVAITASMLAGLGFNPLYAAGLCLIANTAPVAFGSLGIPVVVAAEVARLDLLPVSAIVGLQLSPLALVVPLWLCVTMCGFRRSLEVLPAILVAGICFSVTQFLVTSFHGPYLPVLLAALVTLAGLVALLRFWKPKTIWRFPDETQPTHADDGRPRYAGREILRAWSPYLALSALVFVWGLQSFKGAMAWTVTAVAWPGLHEMVVKTAPIAAPGTLYAAKYTLNFITAGSMAIMLSGFISSFVMPGYGPGKAALCFFRTCRQLRFPVATIVMILALAHLMNYSGMSSTLGLAVTKTGWLFPFFSPLIGWLGVFLTGSDSSSNALFCGLQRTTAEAVGIDPHLTVAANSSGGATGKMISPQSISVATAATDLVGKEGNLFSFTLRHSLAMALVLSVMTLLLAYSLSWMLPPHGAPGM